MTQGVTIYHLSRPDAAIERLAQLDSAACPDGAVLVAAVDGDPRAALPLDGGPAIEQLLDHVEADETSRPSDQDRYV